MSDPCHGLRAFVFSSVINKLARSAAFDNAKAVKIAASGLAKPFRRGYFIFAPVVAAEIGKTEDLKPGEYGKW